MILPMESPQIEICVLRRSVKKSMIDADLDKYEAKKDILPLVIKKLGRKIHKNSYHTAMTGSRDGESSRKILEALREVLQDISEAA